jgi:hypothetical protein
VREAAEEHLRRQVAPVLMAERTSGSDGLRWHRLHWRRDILAATLTLNDDALRAFWSGEHEVQYRRIKSESNPQVFLGSDDSGATEMTLIKRPFSGTGTFEEIAVGIKR